MSLKPVLDQYLAWRSQVAHQCEPLLQQARAQMFAAQKLPEADDEIARIEELVGAKLEPVLLEREADLTAISRAAERYFEQCETPTEQDEQYSERISEGIYPVRDTLERRIASLVAQARARELQQTAPGAGAEAPAGAPGPAAAPPAPAAAPARPPAAAASGEPPPGMRKFCTGCGAKLGPAEWSARQCPACHVAL